MKNNNLYNIRLVKKLLLLVLFHITVIANAQSVPTPDYIIPLDANHPEKFMTDSGIHFSGDKGGTFMGIKNRFGIKDKALMFTDKNSYISIDDKYDIDRSFDVTVSFWTKVIFAQPYPSASSPYNPSTSSKERYFSLATDYKSGGMAKIYNNPILGIERTVNVNNTSKPWYLWLYKNASMEQEGWYHIVMVASTDHTKVYVYKPDGSKACKYNYMGNYFPKRLVIGKKNNYPAERVRAHDYIDDFKLWKMALTEEQIDLLNNNETHIIDGTYKVKLAKAYNQYLHTAYHSTGNGANVEIYPYKGNYKKAYFWDFKKQANGKYRINLHGTDKYLHSAKHSSGIDTNVQILTFDPNYIEAYEWFLERDPYEPQKRFYFHLGESSKYLQKSSTSNNVVIYPFDRYNSFASKLELEKVVYLDAGVSSGNYKVKLANTNQYLHTKFHSTVGSTKVEIYPYDSEYPQAYRWEFVKQQNNTYKIKLEGANGQYLRTVENSTSPSTRVGIYPVDNNEYEWYSDEWILEPIPNATDEYYIKLAGSNNMYLHPVYHSTSPSTIVEIYSKVSGKEQAYRWKLESFPKPERAVIDTDHLYKIELANTSQYLHTVGHSTSGSTKVEILPYNSEYPQAYRWEFVKQHNNTYKIKLESTEQYLHTAENSTSGSTKVEILPYNSKKSYSYEWILEPIPNATDEYYIKLASSTNNMYLHPVYHSTSSSTKVEIYSKVSGKEQAYRWKLESFPKPKRAVIDTDHLYKIELANSSQYLHTVGHSTSGSTKVEIYPYDSEYPQAYRWEFVKQHNNTYKIKLESTEQYLHTAENSTSGSTKVEILPYNSKKSYSYEWILEPIPNATDEYYIKLASSTNNMYLHPVYYSTSPSTKVEIYSKVSWKEQAYRWKLESFPKPKRAVIDTDHLYKIKLADTSQYLHTVGHSTSGSTKVEILPYNSEYPQAYRWEFVKQHNNTYKIKLESTEQYLHTAENSTSGSTKVEILPYNSKKSYSYEWILEPIPNTTDEYYIKLAGSINNMYLHPVYHSTSPSTKVEIFRKVSGEEQAYKWKLESFPKPKRAVIDTDHLYKIKLANTSQYLHTAVHSTSGSTKVEILPYNSEYPQAYRWEFVKQHNNTYKIKLEGTDEQYLHTVSNSTSRSTRVEILPYNSEKSYSYEWILEPIPNTTDEYYIKLAGSINNMYLHPVYHSTSPSTKVEIYSKVSGKEQAYRWKLESFPKPERAVIDTDYLYKIELANTSQYLHTVGHSTSGSTKVEILPYNSEYPQAYRWEFVKQHNNTYKIKLESAEQYLHTAENSTSGSTKVEILPYNSKKSYSYEWILEPIPNATDEYYIKLASSTNNMYLHPVYHSTSPSTKVEIYSKVSGKEQAYRWRLESFPKPERAVIDTDYLYKIELANTSQYLHTVGHSTSGSTKVEILPYDSGYPQTYRWEFVKQLNNTYKIKLKGTEQYLHTAGNSTSRSTKVEILPYNSKKSYSYKWILEPIPNTTDEYYIKLAGSINNMYLHTSAHSTSSSTKVEIFRKVSGEEQAYKWKLESFPKPKRAVMDSGQEKAFIPIGSNAKKSNRKANNELLETAKQDNIENSLNTIFPNPSKGTLNFSFTLKQPETIHFEFYNLLGKKVYSNKQVMSASKQIITLENLKRFFNKSQIYFVKATTSTGENVLNAKVIFE